MMYHTIENLAAKLKVIFLALAISQISFLIVSYFVVNLGINPYISDKNTEYMLSVLTTISVLVCLPLGYFLHDKNLKKIAIENDSTPKTTEYFNSYITKLVLMESASVFCTITYLLTAKNLYSLLSLIVIIAFFICRPSISKIYEELQINKKEENYTETDAENPNIDSEIPGEPEDLK